MLHGIIAVVHKQSTCPGALFVTGLTYYAAVSKAVDQVIAEHAENDPDQAAYYAARAALLNIRSRSETRCAQIVAKLAKELGGGKTP
jgi:hypothetical protein